LLLRSLSVAASGRPLLLLWSLVVVVVKDGHHWYFGHSALLPHKCRGDEWDPDREKDGVVICSGGATGG
jgi:hypothetical protein